MVTTAKCTMPQIIEGQGDDLISRQDLRGRKVRVVVLEAETKAEQDPWLKSLRAWADGHRPVGYPGDDSRERAYSGTLDDPR